MVYGELSLCSLVLSQYGYSLVLYKISSKSAPIASSSESKPEDSDAECLEPSHPKRHCGSSTVPEKHRTKSLSLSSKRTYKKEMGRRLSLAGVG